jgi:hypothetical protein
VGEPARSACVALAILATGWSLSAAETTSYVLEAKAAVGQTQQVQAAVEVKGELKMQPDGSKVTKLPLVVDGTFLFDEKLLDVQSAPWARRSVRYYHQAKADLKVGDGFLSNSLAADHRLLVAKTDKDGSLIFCPQGPLTREELDLVDVQGNSLLWHCLLPQQSVKIGDQWSVDLERLGLLIGLDTITQGEMQCSLTKVERGLAIVECSGNVNGAVGGVASDVQVKAIYNLDLAKKQITWFAANLRESRAIGHAEPGFDVTARIRMSSAPAGQSPALDDQVLNQLTLEPNATVQLLSFRAEKSHYRLIHDRRWRSMFDRHDLCVFRLIDRGDLIAQCNITELPDAGPGKRLTLDAFQADVQRSLGKNFGQFVEASQAKSDDGKTVLRVVVSGAAAEIPIEWIYYHISTDEGRQAALAYTLEERLLDRFAEADRTMVEGFEFTPRPEPRETEKNSAKAERS